MLRTLFALTVAAAMGTAPAYAQDTAATPAPDQAAPAPAAPKVLTKEEAAVGDVYQRTEGDWTMMCEKTVAGDDPCRMSQLLRDDNGNPVIEVELTRLSGENVPAAVLIFNTPVLTLLPEGVTLTIDGGNPAKLPFLFCEPKSCVSRVNLREADTGAFKRGSAATVRIVPMQAPDNSVTVKMSLAGFTAAYDSLQPVGQ